MNSSSKYQMTINLNVLNHLGINLYSNVPAVLSEVVANAWDADATNVDIEIDDDKITITDDGDGMTLDDINGKYLMVGYKRRKGKEDILTAKGRSVMGRKGIGKLSLFSIANIARVESVKAGEKNGFVMSVKEIEDHINREEQTPYKQTPYEPDSLSEDDLTLNQEGTQIVLAELTKKVTRASATALQKRLARRFSVIGTNDFNVKINGRSVTVTDRDYFHKIQYLWHFGNDSEKYIELCKSHSSHKLENAEQREDKIEFALEGDSEDNGYRVRGWIGTVFEPKDLKDADGDNLNKIVIMVRGKLAQEDILEDFPEARIYTKYLIGEIHADFLDIDKELDIATSNRQEIIKDDSRYQALQKWVDRELKNIRNQWTELRHKDGIEDARKIPAIAEWLDGLREDRKRLAYAMLGKINEHIMDDERYRIDLYKQSILLFEKMQYKGLLEKLDRVSAENLPALTEIFSGLDEIEAYLYYEIVQERLRIIEKLHKHVAEDEKEKVIQKYLYNHLWLLNPSWDRATANPSMEQNVQREFDNLEAGLTQEEKDGRYDIKYKMTSGKHVIIELKRADRILSHNSLLDQVEKYGNALRKLLRAANKKEPVEIICIVGKPLSQWSDAEQEDRSRRMMAQQDVRVVLYDELIVDAYQEYQVFLDKNEEAGRIYNIVQSIEMDLDIES